MDDELKKTSRRRPAAGPAGGIAKHDLVPAPPNESPLAPHSADAPEGDSQLPAIIGRIERALAEIARCDTPVRLWEIADSLRSAQTIRDEALLLERVVRLRKMGNDAARRAAEVRLRSERTLFELLSPHIARGAPRKNVDLIDNFQRTTLAAHNISRDLFAHCRRVAAIPEQHFGRFFRHADEFDWEITTAEFYRRTDAYQMSPPIINAHLTPQKRPMRTVAPATHKPHLDLRHGDCFHHMANIADHSVDLIATDLPYYVNRGGHWNTPIDLDRLWAEYKRIVRPNHVIVLHGIQPFTARLVMSNEAWFKTEIIWEKHRAANFIHADFRVMTVHENIVVFSAGVTARAGNRMPYYPHQPEDQAAGYPTSILYYELDKPRLHPAAKPVGLMRYLIELYSRPGATVLDCCMGSGSTGVASLQSGRNFIGIELDGRYFKVAAERLREFEPSLRLGGGFLPAG